MSRCWLVVAALCVLAVGAAASRDESELDVDLDLSLPSFPPAPKRDRVMLHEEAEDDSEDWAPHSELSFKASSLPRFRTDRGGMTDWQDDSDVEATLAFGGDESRTLAVTPQAMEEDQADEDLTGAPQTPYFQAAYLEQGARLRRPRGGPSVAMDPSQLPPVPQNLSPYESEPLPPPPAGMASMAAYAAAQQNARANSQTDELFTPIPTVPRRYGSQPVESLNANPGAYAYANARQPYQPYQYPVQAQAFAQPAPLAAPGAMGAVFHDPYSNSMAGVRVGQDLAQSEYQTYSQHNWPSAVAPPSHYYLPPDLVI